MKQVLEYLNGTNIGEALEGYNARMKGQSKDDCMDGAANARHRNNRLYGWVAAGKVKNKQGV